MRCLNCQRLFEGLHRQHTHPTYSELAATLVTGATGFIGSNVARLLVERGDEVRLGVEEGSPDVGDRRISTAARVKLEVRDRRSVRRALKGVERVFHCAGVTSVRPADEARLFDVNVGGTKLVMEESLRAEVERVVYTSSAAAVGPAADRKAATETQLFTASRLGIPYVNSVHEAEVEAMRVAAHGLPLVCVNPAVCLGAGDQLLSSTRLVRSFLLGRIPVYTDGAIGIVDVRDAAAGHLLADLRGAVGERYLLTRSELHLRASLRGPGAAVGRAHSGADSAASRRGGGNRARRGPARVADHPVRGARGGQQLDLSLHQGAARARLARAPARGDARGHGCLAPGARARPHRPHAPLTADPVPRGRPGARGRRGSGGRGAPRDRPLRSRAPSNNLRGVTTLYRCKAPTDLVCRCGKVARRMRAMEIDFDEVRVPFLKRDRPEVEELTGQRWVPVLVHGDDVIHDSHRILEYLEWLERKNQ